MDATVLDTGCCGLAGNFGFERGHYDVSVACAEDKLLPAIRDADAATVVMADGFSCRTQIATLAHGRTALHTAEVLAAGLRGEQPNNRTEMDDPTPLRTVALLAGGL